MTVSTRRQLLAATALVALARVAPPAEAATGMPWSANEAYPPTPVVPGPWLFFNADEAQAVEAIVDRLIPADELGPGGRAAGCAVFIDRQLTGPYGTHEWLYMQGPFPSDPLPSQGMQSPLTPRQQYRQGLAALAEYCRTTFAGKTFHQLAPVDQDRVLTGLEKGDIHLNGFSGTMLFNALLANTMEGFFADPIYGGNKDMCGWKLVGFPGTRYDYRDVIANPNKPYTLPPVSLQGRPEWNRSAG
ncbi:MAG TPA: gluconate 2-dehydrogenase subunit 3 family protein [Roseomonas sp.]|jgi:gluconate 2-dehydrogenase gamma chain